MFIEWVLEGDCAGWVGDSTVVCPSRVRRDLYRETERDDVPIGYDEDFREKL